MQTTTRLVLLIAILADWVCGNDETLVENTSGTSVVNAVCNKIESFCVFDDDNLFLRRIAFVETSDGTDPKSYRTGYFGGIWQIDQNMLQETQSSFSVNVERQNISAIFGIQWNSVKWSDLQKPFFSGLAARLFIEIKKRSTLAKISSLSDQANFWKNYYRTSGDANVFINKLNSFQSKCKSGAADVIFIVDESGSIGFYDFNVTKEFLVNVVNSLNVGPDPVKDTRVSVVKFSDYVTPVFGFKNYTTKAMYTSAIRKMSYFGGGTRTDLALAYLREKGFTNNSLARLDGVPKIAVVLTDGQSNNFYNTLDEANKLKKTDITILTVGIGSGVNKVELKAIATDPVCKHLFLLDSFQSFDSFLDVIEKKTCEAPVTVNNETTIFVQPSGKQNCKITVSSNGMTIQVFNSGGNSTIYFSNVTTPSSSFYDLKSNFGKNPVNIYLPYYSHSNDTTYAYCVIEGDPVKDINVTLIPCPGDCDPCSKRPCPAGETCKNQKSFKYACEDFENPVSKGIDTTDSPINGVTPSTAHYDCISNNPCTPEHVLQQLFYFPHADSTKYVQCDEWGSCFTMPCPTGTTWISQSMTCG